MWDYFYQQRFTTYIPSKLPEKEVLVLITGAAKGIGRDAALALAAEGYHVYVTVRKESDGEVLKKDFISKETKNKGSIRPVLMDVRDGDSIDKAFNVVKKAVDNGAIFAGLVNNAGMGTFALAELTTEAEMKTMFDVNFFGVVNVTKKFLPLIRASKGRIVMIGSIVGVFSPPGSAGYNATKFAIEGYSDALRREVESLGVSVSIVEPGAIATPAIATLDTDEKKKAEEPDQEVSTAYKDVLEQIGVMFGKIFGGAIPPKVSTTPTILKALQDEYPKTRYVIANMGKHSAKKIARMVRSSPDRAVDKWLINLD